MSKIYTASMLRRPATSRSDKLHTVAGGSSLATYASPTSPEVSPGAGDSVFWKYFGLDENGALYVKQKEDGEARDLWTFGQLAGGGLISSPSGQPPSGVSSVFWDQKYPSTGERIAIITIDGQDIDIYAPKALTEGTDYLSPGHVQSRIDTAVGAVTALIPSAATAQNQLADKAFVNSSIATNTGSFKGTFSSTSQLPSANVNANDYAFVTTTDANNNTVYNRYKYDGSQWVFEYALNNSSFTAAQWSAINSGITSEKVTGYDSLVSNVQSDWNANSGLAAILNKPDIPTVVQSTGSSTANVMSQKAVTDALRNYLPLTGGTLSKNGVDVLSLKNTNANGVQLRFLSSSGQILSRYEWDSYWGANINVNNASGTFVGGLGIFPDGTPYKSYPAQDGVNVGYYAVLHEGNWRDYISLDFRRKASIGSNEDLNDIFDPTVTDYSGNFRYYAFVGKNGTDPNATAGIHGFPTDSFANALLTIDTFKDSTSLVLYQMGFSSDGSIYFRNGTSNLSNGTWGDPFSGNGNWKRLLWEDHNGDATVTRDLTVGRHVIVSKGYKVSFDAAGTSYMMRGSAANDYGMYIHSGVDASDNAARLFLEAGAVHVRKGCNFHFSAYDAEANPWIGLNGAATGNARNDFYISNQGYNIYMYANLYCVQGGDFTPYDNGTQKLGRSDACWSEGHIKRWYPNPNDSAHYIEYDSQNSAFKIVGDVYATGQIAAGGLISNS